MRTRLATVAAAGAAAVLVAGCGGGGGDQKTVGKNAKRYFGDQRDVAQVVDDLTQASQDGDATRICDDIFSSRFSQELASRAGGSCEAKVRQTIVNPTEDIMVQQLAISGRQALATVKEQNGKTSRLIFVRQGGTWRIDSIN